jgi:lipopolysaccharide transport system ATP-binding protein
MLVNLAKAPIRRMQRLSGRGGDGWFWALRDVSFDIQPGEVAAVIGRNGAGKSTLLKILSRITEPTEGRIELRGRVASLLEVGTGFHPDLTGRENIFLNGAILGMRRAEIRRKFDAIVDFAEVSAFIDTPVKHYSSGMYLRLAFSVAAHLDGEVLLVDEVLAVGDAAFQKKCLGKMQDVSRAGRTVVFISHNMAAVSALCTRAIVFEGGRPVFDGTARDGVRQYLENNLGDSALTWDLAATSRTEGDLGSLVRLESVTALTARGDGFRFAEPLRFRASVASTVTLEHLECALGLDDMFGSRVVTFVSDRQQISTTAGGRYNIDVTVPPFGLRPGRYLLSVSLYSGGHYHDYLVHFGALSIVPLHDDGEGHVDDQSDRGPIAVASEWRVSEIPTVALV